MTEYFTIKQLIEETDRDYFIVSVRVEFVNPETELEDYLITEVEIPFEDVIDFEKEYELSDDGIKELESDLSEYAEKDESEILDLAESAVLRDFPDAEILSSKIVQVSLPDVMYEYLDEFMGIEPEKKEQDLLLWQRPEREEEESFIERKNIKINTSKGLRKMKDKLTERLKRLKRLLYEAERFSVEEWEELDFDPEEMKEWLKAGIKNPYVALEWKKYGFTPEETAEWHKFKVYDPEAAAEWREWKFTPQEAYRWSGGHFDLEESGEAPLLAAWRDLGWDPKEANKWLAAGFYTEKLIFQPFKYEEELENAKEALRWKEAGITPEEAEEWYYEERFDDPEEVKRWMAAGFEAEEAHNWKDWDWEPEEAREWKNAGFDNPEEATKWYNADFDAKEAMKWREAGFEPEEAKKLSASKLRPKEIIKWRSIGVEDVEEMKRWKNLILRYDLSLKEIEEFIKRGLSPFDAVDEIWKRRKKEEETA